MYEKTNSLCLTMQRYDKKWKEENLFNEAACFFSQAGILYFVSISFRKWLVFQLMFQHLPASWKE